MSDIHLPKLSSVINRNSYFLLPSKLDDFFCEEAC